MRRREWGDGHEFAEDVNDASMCLCGVPVLGHDTTPGNTPPDDAEGKG